MAQKNQDHVDQSVFTPKNSLPQSKITPSTTKNSSQSCAVSDTGRTCSKEPKSLSWSSQIMPISIITATQGKSVHASQGTSRKGSNTTSSWNINLELQTTQTPYPAAQTMKAITLTMMTYLYGLTSTSVNNIQPSESSIPTV